MGVSVRVGSEGDFFFVVVLELLLLLLWLLELLFFLAVGEVLFLLLMMLLLSSLGNDLNLNSCSVKVAIVGIVGRFPTIIVVIIIACIDGRMATHIISFALDFGIRIHWLLLLLLLFCRGAVDST